MLCILSGCGTTSTFQGKSYSFAIKGNAHGGQQPLFGAAIQMYAMSTNGDATAATPLLSQTVLTDESGNFSLTGLYTCPSASAQVYLVATGGNPGLASGTNNKNIAELATLGPCAAITDATYVSINEVTTVAAVWPLASFMSSAALIGSGPSDQAQLIAAVQSVNELVDTGLGIAPGPALPAGSIAPTAKLNSMGDILAACINSPGGSAGDGSICGNLFALATIPGQAAPTNTIDAALAIARNPTQNVTALFGLLPPQAPFQPHLNSAPSDWTLTIQPSLPAPSSSLATGVYSSAQQLAFTDTTAGAAIYYTTDGTTPTANSKLYTGPLTISSSQTIEAVAINGKDVSSVTFVLITIKSQMAVSVSPSDATVGAAQTASFTATVTGAQNGTVIWTLSPSIGTISANGVYTAPASISAAQSVTITAASLADPTKNAMATVSLKPVSVAVSPGTATLTSQQTQQFTATVSGPGNPNVTWAISPALGSISQSGLYTPPSTITSNATVSVTATSVADPSKSATSSISLAPTQTGHTYYLSPSGRDDNSGLTSSAAWLTPNHSGLSCGDTIVAAPGNYNAMTITTTPSCSTHDAVWVKCAAFDGCKINQDVWSQGGIDVQASYWAFVGWEVTAKTGPWASCFAAIPGNNTPGSIHDIYFINDIANGCMAGGFVAANNGSSSVDYLVVAADVVYNAAQGSAYCYSGVSVLQPVATDTLPGTHIYISQVFAWQNLEPATCAGGPSTDGDGIILDTFNGVYAGLPPYAQQAVIEDAITVYNGAFGVLAGGGVGNSNSPMFVKNVTAYGNFINTTQNQGMCGQMASFGWPTTIAANANRFTTFTGNLAVAQSAHLSGCGNNTPYAYYFGNIDGTDDFSGNAGYSASGQAIGYTGLTAGFLKGINTVGTDPALANPVEPSAPSCSGKASVIDCMSPVIANFKPTNSAFASYGYQPPSSAPVYNPLFPSWLCGNANMPSGLVTMGCLTSKQ